MTAQLKEDISALLRQTAFQLDRALERRDYKVLRQLQQDADRVLADFLAETDKDPAPVLQHRKGGK